MFNDESAFGQTGYKVIANATAAAATISTAIAAVSTVMHVASLVTS